MITPTSIRVLAKKQNGPYRLRLDFSYPKPGSGGSGKRSLPMVPAYAPTPSASSEEGSQSRCIAIASPDSACRCHPHYEILKRTPYHSVQIERCVVRAPRGMRGPPPIVSFVQQARTQNGPAAEFFYCSQDKDLWRFRVVVKFDLFLMRLQQGDDILQVPHAT